MDAPCSALPQIEEDDFEARTARNINNERLKILFSPDGFSCLKLCNARRARQISGIPVFVVLVLFFFERLAYYSTLGYAFPAIGSDVFARTVAFNLIAQLMYPIAGWLADYKVGRHNMMLAGLFLLFVGYSSFSLTVSFYYFYPSADHLLQRSGLLYVCVVVISMGTAGFQANAIPFGADQIMFGTSEQLSSYFHWYYWTQNLGGVLALIPCLVKNDPKIVLAVSLNSVFYVSIALVTDSCCRNTFFVEPTRKNPLKSVLKVVWFAVTAKRPQRISAFGYDGRDRPSRIDLAKAKHGGICSVDEVEDVKTVLRLVPTMLAIGGVSLLYTGSISVVQPQAYVMWDSQSLQNRSSQLYWFVNALTIVLFIPLAELVIFPCLRDRVPSMLKRIGLSLIIISVSLCILLVYEEGDDLPGGLAANVSSDVCTLAVPGPTPHIAIDYEWVLLPLILISIAEVLLMVPALEFFYAQSPQYMRGMAIGFFFFVNGLFGTLAAVILHILQKVDHCGRWYYVLELILATLAFVLFTCTAVWYKYRKRTGLEDSGQFYRF